MSRFHREYVLCPHCANEQEVVVWDLIDVRTDPDLKERLLKKLTQSFDCHNCGESVIMAEPFLYRDTERRLLYYYAPQWAEKLEQDPLGLERDDEIRAALRRIAEPLLAEDGQDAQLSRAEWKLRICGTYNNIIEKILADDRDMDDRLIELIKIALQTRYLEEENMRFEEIYFLDAGEAHILFQVLESTRGWQQLEIKRELYDHAAQNLEQRLPANKNWTCVNATWARLFATRPELFD